MADLLYAAVKQFLLRNHALNWSGVLQSDILALPSDEIDHFPQIGFGDDKICDQI